MDRPWERLDGETFEEYLLFSRWLKLSPAQQADGQTVAYLAREVGVEWAAVPDVRERNRWAERAAAWQDQYIDPEIVRALRNRDKALRGEISALGLTLVHEAMRRYVQRVVEGEDVPAADLQRVMDLSDKASRRAFGDADVKVDIGKRTPADLSTEELNALLQQHGLPTLPE